MITRYGDKKTHMAASVVQVLFWFLQGLEYHGPCHEYSQPKTYVSGRYYVSDGNRVSPVERLADDEQYKADKEKY